MAIFNSLTFDGINSLEFGIYVTGSAVWNAPERDVSMIVIPGRNGNLALDNGRFENIEVTYPAGVFADSMEEYAEKIRAFRNQLVSRYNYVKLYDTYNPDEYRLALYKSGLEANPVRYNSAAEFDITFECKPQRFLKEGDEEAPLTEDGYLITHSGAYIVTHNGRNILVKKGLGKLVNPTEFASQPLIIAKGTGTIGIGNQIITITGTATQTIYIDCESMEIYTKQGPIITPASSLVSFNTNEFPTIPPGESGFNYTTSSVQIIPRWWRL